MFRIFTVLLQDIWFIVLFCLLIRTMPRGLLTSPFCSRLHSCLGGKSDNHGKWRFVPQLLNLPLLRDDVHRRPVQVSPLGHWIHVQELWEDEFFLASLYYAKLNERKNVQTETTYLKKAPRHFVYSIHWSDIFEFTTQNTAHGYLCY